MFEQCFDSKDVAVVLAAADLMSADTDVTVWINNNRLMICLPARSGTRTFVLQVGGQVTVATTEMAVDKTYRPATLKLLELQRLLSQNGVSLRVSLDVEERCLAVCGMRSGSGNSVLPDHIRAAEITLLEFPA